MTDPQTWVMINTVTYANGETRREGVYTVRATSEEEARERIETELAIKPHRQAILRTWRAEGKPVRMMRPRLAAARRKR